MVKKSKQGLKKPARNRKGWATDDQRAWLEQYLPHFLEAQRKKTTQHFFCNMYESWFDKYPEAEVWYPSSSGVESPQLTLAKTQDVEDKISERKLTLHRWFYHQTQVHGVSKKSSAHGLFTFAAAPTKQGPAPKLLRPDQMYQKLYPEKVLPKMADERAKMDVKDRSARTSLQFRTAIDLFRNESDEVKEHVAKENRKQKDERLAALNEEQVTESVEDDQTPEEYQRAINACPEVINDGLEELSKRTGWSWLLIGGGPVPSANGAIYKKHFYAGPTSQAGNKFMSAYPGFEENVIKPWGKFVSSCFSTDIRRQRALPTPGLTPVETSILDTPGLISLERSSTPVPITDPNDTLSCPSTPIGIHPVSSSPPYSPPSISPRKDALGRYRSDQHSIRSEGDASEGDVTLPSISVDTDLLIRSDPPDMGFPSQPPGGPSSPYAHAFRSQRHNSLPPSTPTQVLSPAGIASPLIDPALLLVPSEGQLNSIILNGPILPGFGGIVSPSNRTNASRLTSSPLALSVHAPSLIVHPPLNVLHETLSALPVENHTQPLLPNTRPRPRPIKKIPATSLLVTASIMSADLRDGSATSDTSNNPVINDSTGSDSSTHVGEDTINDAQLTRAQKAAKTKALRKAQRDAEKEPEGDSAIRKKRKENSSAVDTTEERRSSRKIVAPTPRDAGASPIKPKKRAARKR